MLSKLIILGAGGHGRVVAEIAELLKHWEHIDFLDDRDDMRDATGVKIIGKLADYLRLNEKYQYAIVAFGDNQLRLSWTNKLKEAGYTIPTLIHPFSWVSPKSVIGEGTVVMPGSIVNTLTKVGRACILNTSSSIDHDCVLEDGVHISPGAHIGGTVQIGSCTWVCIGASIANNVTIGEKVIIAAGSTVLRSVNSNVLFGGVPGKIIKNLG